MLPTMVNTMAIIRPNMAGMGKIIAGTWNGIIMSKEAMKNFAITAPLKR